MAAGKKEIELKKAREELQKCKDEIKKGKPKNSDVPDSVAGILTASDQTDWHRIKYFEKNMKGAIKDKFRTHLEKLDELTSLQQEGSKKSHGPPYDAALGQYWHEILKKKLRQEKIKEVADDILAGQLIDKLKEQFNITLLEPEFQLYGYVYNKTEIAPKVYLWNDVRADAIGWHHKEKKYVIVDYKVVDLLQFWETPEAYGKFLHQCLVYARLLQLHMKLEYLPPILLVPISNNDARDIHPGLFLNYPDECKRAINVDVWSVTLPKPPLKIKAQKPFKNDVKPGPVNEDRDAFNRLVCRRSQGKGLN